MISAPRLACIGVVWHQSWHQNGENINPRRFISTRLAFSNRRNHIKQKVKVAGQHTLYHSVHDNERQAEIFLSLMEAIAPQNSIGLYDVIARLMRLALQDGAPPEKVGDLLTGVEFESYGSIGEHDCLKHCAGLPDLIGGHLLVECCCRSDFAHSRVLSRTDCAR